MLDRDENDIDDDDPVLQDPQLILDWIEENKSSLNKESFN